MRAIIQIVNGSMIYEPAVEDGITWSTERRGSPSKLTFKAVYDTALNIQEGNSVSLLVDGMNVFYGYIFKKSEDKEKLITITAYDQLRYFKNKDTYMYEGKKASQLLNMVCEDFHLETGTVEDTGYVIPKRIEQNKTLFDIIQSALDHTMMNTNKLYCLYDDFGAITLKNIESMKVPLLIDEETGQNYDYTSSIDEQTYNQIKLAFDDKKIGKRINYIARDSNNINAWGVLQHYGTLQEGENGAEKANVLLKYYNRKTRNLTIKDAWGDIRVRAGTAPLVRLTFNDMVLSNFMLCESATHTFNNEEHTMTLKLIGGEFIA